MPKTKNNKVYRIRRKNKIEYPFGDRIWTTLSGCHNSLNQRNMSTDDYVVEEYEMVFRQTLEYK